MGEIEEAIKPVTDVVESVFNFIFGGKAFENFDAPKMNCKTVDKAQVANDITAGAGQGAQAGPYGAAGGALLGSSNLVALCGGDWEKKLRALAKQGVKWAKDELKRIDDSRLAAQRGIQNAPKNAQRAAENGVKDGIKSITGKVKSPF